ncbi:MAG TPA: hypothetical protein VKY65_21965 [Alphaproteobacteria bacterium]|nr:hypothetical protein [Alphaproteobacteria bacterium]
MRISFHHSHAYPGCRATIADLPREAGRAATALVEFSDGAISSATWESAGDGEIAIAVDAYRTARGTHVARKQWRLRRADGSGNDWVVAR